MPINEATGSTKIILSILFFPMFFQNMFMSFAWGKADIFWLAIAKRIFILLPTLAIILACWATIVSLVTVIIRQNRTDFVTSLFVTWWDLGKAIFAFWGGIFIFAFYLVQSLFGFARLMVLGLWVFILDLIFLPFRAIRNMAENVLNPGIPWIAVMLMIFWCLFEATLFTYVTSPLVIDTLSNLIGDQLSERFVRFPLFLFMLFIILGSYAVLSSLTEAIKTRKITTIIKIGLVESVAMFVEVVFLYREFVDALVPWFAQHSAKGFDLGITGTLAIAGFTWLGVRSLSWFLFASHGTPVIMAVIQGVGYKPRSSSGSSGKKEVFVFTINSIGQIKKEINWIQTKGDQLLGSFILPPLQVVAATANFCVFLVTSTHLFDIPLTSIRGVMESKPQLRKVAK